MIFSDKNTLIQAGRFGEFVPQKRLQIHSNYTLHELI